jgi:hypothetical protein
MHIVMPGMAAARTSGLVGPDHSSLRVRDGENILSVRSANEHKALSLGVKGEQQGYKNGKQAKWTFHVDSRSSKWG